jgi:hypothetical protein
MYVSLNSIAIDRIVLKQCTEWRNAVTYFVSVEINLKLSLNQLFNCIFVWLYLLLIVTKKCFIKTCWQDFMLNGLSYW